MGVHDEGSPASALSKGALLQVIDVKKYFPVYGGVFSRPTAYVHAVDGVSFAVGRGETFALVGESGCGKTTLGRVILRLTPTIHGRVFFEGQDVFALSPREMIRLRREMQIVFQDPGGSLDSRMTVAKIISEPLEVHGIAQGGPRKMELVGELLHMVGMQASDARRYPHEFSGGQRQRIALARALALRPKLIVCDEPVSSLDVSVQSQILNLLDELQEQLGLSYIFIAHGLQVVKHVSNRVGVMYLGKLVEVADKGGLFSRPYHPYTEALLSAVPVPDPNSRRERILLVGDVPSPVNPPSGCRFHPRCRIVKAVCTEIDPPLREVDARRLVACHLRC